MPLINKNVPPTPTVKETATTDRTSLENKIKNPATKTENHVKGLEPERYQLGAKNRKNIKVSENDLTLIKAISATRDMKVYEVIHEMVTYYAKNELNDREVKLINSLLGNKR